MKNLRINESSAKIKLKLRSSSRKLDEISKVTSEKLSSGYNRYDVEGIKIISIMICFPHLVIVICQTEEETIACVFLTFGFFFTFKDLRKIKI